jgi:galactokinase
VRALRDATLEQVSGSASLSPVERMRARHVVTENARVHEAVHALEQGDFAATGPLLSASHASLRDDFEVTVPELDTAADAAVEGGALGARMIGGGFGGCVLALVRETDVDAVFEAVRRAFEQRGFAPPGRLLARPSPGARRLA